MLIKEIPFEENFIFNKDEANIDYIQNLLEFSSLFGKEQFFTFEKFYKKGDEKKLLKDYKLQQIGISYFKKYPEMLSELRTLITKIKNIRNIYNNDFFKLTETDLFDLKQFILNFMQICSLFKKLEIDLLKNIPEIEKILDIFEKKNKSIPSFYIYPDYTEKLSHLYQNQEKIEKEILRKQKQIEKEIGNKFLKITFDTEKIILKNSEYYKNFYNFINYFDITEDNSIYIKIKLKHTDYLIDLTKKLSEINEQIILEKENILNNISYKIFKEKNIILEAFNTIGIIDSFLTKILFAIKFKGIIPEINYNKFQLLNAKNIYLEKILKDENLEYTPLTINLEKGLAVITGSNMGGKTWVLKTIAQIAYMVHAGLMIPAQKVIIPLFNGIFIKTNQDKFSIEGLSSFGFEIFSLKKVWEKINNFFLILLDEPAKGTNPIEGQIIVKTLAKFLSSSNSFSIITTHFDNITKKVKCKKFIIKGISEENFISYIEFLKNKSKISKSNQDNSIIDIKTIHKFIDHKIVEVNRTLQVPKNAIKLMQLFDFDKDFIKQCKKSLSYNRNDKN